MWLLNGWETSFFGRNCREWRESLASNLRSPRKTMSGLAACCVLSPTSRAGSDHGGLARRMDPGGAMRQCGRCRANGVVAEPGLSQRGRRAEYGQEILATLWQELAAEFGNGYSYSALTRFPQVSCCAIPAFSTTSG